MSDEDKYGCSRRAFLRSALCPPWMMRLPGIERRAHISARKHPNSRGCTPGLPIG